MSLLNGNLEKIAEGVWLRLISRWAMIIAATLLPVFGYIGNRAITAADVAVVQLQETTVQLRLMQQEIKDDRAARDTQFSGFAHSLDDHEHRIRTLEVGGVIGLKPGPR